MIKSMTAFAVFKQSTDKITVTTEIRSYNSRHLDISLRVPHGFQSLEEKIKSFITNKVVRGRVEIRISIQEDSEESNAFEVNFIKASAFHRALSQLNDKLELNGSIPLELVLSGGGIIKPLEIQKDMDLYWDVIKQSLDQALTDLDQMRATEGACIANDFDKRLKFIHQKLKLINDQSQNLLQVYTERLKDRITALTYGIIELDPARITQEAAILSDKSDISEEITRSLSHLDQFQKIMEAKEPGGRKLNFLLQELNREFNTMGSKIGNADTAHIIVTVKAELEKLREQVQNVE